MEWADRLHRSILEKCPSANSATTANRVLTNPARAPIGTIGASGNEVIPQKSLAQTPAAALVQPLLSDPAELLSHLRDVLHCRVTVEAERLVVRPAHRCPPLTLAALMLVKTDVLSLIAMQSRGCWLFARLKEEPPDPSLHIRP